MYVIIIVYHHALVYSIMYPYIQANIVVCTYKMLPVHPPSSHQRLHLPSAKGTQLRQASLQKTSAKNSHQAERVVLNKRTWKAKDTPILKATGLLVLGVFSCPKKIGHLAL